MNTKALYHWGILGMRWGVRRFQNEDGSLTAAGRARYSENRDVRDMSDAELNQRINRIRKEQEYKELTEPKALKAVKKVVSTVLVVAGLEVVKELSKKKMAAGLASLENRAGNSIRSRIWNQRVNQLF